MRRPNNNRGKVSLARLVALGATIASRAGRDAIPHELRSAFTIASLCPDVDSALATWSKAPEVRLLLRVAVPEYQESVDAKSSLA